MSRQLSKLSKSLIETYDKPQALSEDRTISVNPVVSEMATWYEKFRTAMDYRDDEVILRSSIERILKRRLLFQSDGALVATPLIRELVWARYFPDSTIGEATVLKVASSIELYLKFEQEVNKKNRINRNLVNEWMLHLLSSEIEHILKPSRKKDLICNFMFGIFKEQITIEDDNEEARDVQIFIAVRRSFANDDLAFLRYHLFNQYFGSLTKESLDKISDNFMEGLSKINSAFNYPLKDRIYNYIKNETVPFLILDDVLRENSGKIIELTGNSDGLDMAILNACSRRYRTISAKVRRAVIRSIIFIFVTKAALALTIEGSFDKFFYGRIIWSSIALNTLTPPIIMIIVGFLINTQSRENSFKILRKINSILFDEKPKLNNFLIVKKKPNKTDPILWGLFIILWLATFALSFGAIVFVLSKLRVNPLSQSVFVFFLAIVSFVSYRINKTANMYVVKENKENWTSIAFDFFFMPFIQVGRKLTQAVSQINIILFIFDFIIETPFKGIFAFFEQWLLFLRTQREKLE